MESRQNRWSNQRSGMIIGVQFQNFGVCAGARASKFSFSKKSRGAQILIFGCKNWHGASFYIKKQTQKYKFEIWLLKSTILDQRKSAFLVFEEKKTKTNFSLCFGFDSALITIDAPMFVWLVFLKMHTKKVIDLQKWHYGRFWRLITVCLCI